MPNAGKTLLASGFIAGALMGVASAAIYVRRNLIVMHGCRTWSEVLALGAYAILIFLPHQASMKTK